MSDIATVYAQALYALAKEEGLAADIAHELSALRQGFTAEPEYLRLLNNPALSKRQRCRILDDSFRGTIAPYLLNFLKILTEERHIFHFSRCCDIFRESYNRDHNILIVTATTVQPLSTVQKQRLTEKLTAITGKHIQLSNRIDASILGGVQLDYDGQRLEDTVSHRLDAIGKLLKKTAL